MLKEWQMDTPEGFLQVSHVLGLNDTLWVKPEPSALGWADVSLYSNPFDDVAARTAFETGLHGLRLSSTSPEFTSEGSYPKCWRMMPEGIMLYKTGSTGASNTGLEPYSEAMASKIATRMKGTDTVAYGLARFKDRLCSTCRLFTDESTGFVPAYKIFSDNPPRNIAQALKLCGGLGFDREFRDMIVLDAVPFNQDRHLGNFGSCPAPPNQKYYMRHGRDRRIIMQLTLEKANETMNRDNGNLDLRSTGINSLPDNVIEIGT